MWKFHADVAENYAKKIESVRTPALELTDDEYEETIEYIKEEPSDDVEIVVIKQEPEVEIYDEH